MFSNRGPAELYDFGNAFPIVCTLKPDKNIGTNSNLVRGLCFYQPVYPKERPFAHTIQTTHAKETTDHSFSDAPVEWLAPRVLP